MKKKKTILPIAITIILLVMLAIGTTYTYYIAIGNTRSAIDVNVRTGDGQARLGFNTGQALTLNINPTTLSRTSGNIKVQGRPTITLEDIDVTDFPTSYYYAYLNILSNDFEYDVEGVAEVLLQIKDPTGTTLTTHPTLGNVVTVTDINGDSVTGFDITTFSGLVTLAENYQISVPNNSETGITTHVWEVDIVYVNMNINQLKNQNKTLNAEFILQSYKYGTDPFHFTQTYAYDSKNQAQTFEVPKTGHYLIEMWGAQGGNGWTSAGGNGYCTGGKGAYTTGIVGLTEDEVLYLYIGGKGTSATASGQSYLAGGFNGGGNGGYGGSDDTPGSGGGATDIRYFGNYTPTTEDLAWNSTIGLNSRIMVASGGGGGSCINNTTYTDITYRNGAALTNASQTAAGWSYSCTLDAVTQTSVNFGYGASAATSEVAHGAGGAGGGYYGGSFCNESNHFSGGQGGTSYISGHTGCVAITASDDRTPISGCTGRRINQACSYHYSEKVFIDTDMISGTNEMPSIDGTLETGHADNGNIKIKYLGNRLFNITLDKNDESATEIIGIYSVEQLPTPTRHGYNFTGWYDASVDGNLIDDRDELVDGMTLYAHWDVNPYADYTLKYSITSPRSFAAGAYEDTPWTINWNKDFVVLTDFKVDKSLERYLILGNYNSTNELNVEIYNDMIRLYSGGDIATGSKSIPIGKFVHLELTWNHTTQNLTANLSWDEDTDTANGTKSISDTSSTTIRIGAQDRRGDSTTFKAITYNNMYIYEHN